MKKAEYEELLRRLDLLSRLNERSLNTWRSVEKIEKHMEKLNNSVADNQLAIAENRVNIESNRRLLNFIIRYYVPVILVMVAAALGTKITGLW